MPTTSAVIRYGRHEMQHHSAAANGQITAGDIVVEENGGDTVAPAPATLNNDQRFFVAIDDRERGMEIGDTYADGDNVRYISLSSGAGVNVNMADGNTLDPTTETRLVMSATAGRVAPYDSANDAADDVILDAEETESIAASGSEEPVSAAPL